MSRVSSDLVDRRGVVRSGYDYKLQVWVEDYIIWKCGHNDSLPPVCNACKYHGEDIRLHDHEWRETGNSFDSGHGEGPGQ